MVGTWISKVVWKGKVFENKLTTGPKLDNQNGLKSQLKWSYALIANYHTITTTTPLALLRLLLDLIL
jgi:hypothetical protein